MTSRALLLDIEGTITPITFVTETLFPYARQHGREFILNHLCNEEIQTALAQLRAESVSDRAKGAPVIEGGDSQDAIEQTILYYLWLIDVDRKSTPLKTIQGRIWQEGYRLGELKSAVFPDVPPALTRWRKQERMIAIYSSGSVLAQQELFRHSDQGDLTALIDAYFDTRVGPKKLAGSYMDIAEALKLPAQEILFASDVVEELDAAQAAGVKTVYAVRPGNPPQPEDAAHRVIHSFDELP